MSDKLQDWWEQFRTPQVIDLAPMVLGQLAWIRVNGTPAHTKQWLLNYHKMYYPRSVTYMPKTKRPRKVHFVWADTNDVKCEVRQDGNTLYSKWAPDVTCAICRQMMVNRGVTRIL